MASERPSYVLDQQHPYAADEDDYILVGRCTVETLGSIDAVLAHFDAADYVIPPLVVTSGE